jgi:putative polyketide hydroxylase
VSTLDTFGRGFVLLTGPDGAVWQEAAASRREPIEVLTVGEAGDLQASSERFAELYGIESDGAVLVRPDGFVGWRTSHAGGAPGDDLARALATISKT